MKKLFALFALGAAIAHAELPAEPVGKIRTLPVPYPPHWVLVHDAAFFHMSDGKVIVMDADASGVASQYKGMVNNSGIGSVATSAKRREIYIAETFHSRGQRGERTDVLTIYDQATLAPVAEVVLPGGKRMAALPERYALQPVDGDRLMLVFNLTPATSVTVVDLEARRILGEVPTPGCSLAYPTGPRGFSSVCSDGSFMSVQLDAAGKVAKQSRTKAVVDTEKDPVFAKTAIHDGVAYFPTFLGEVVPVDLRGDAAKPGKPWSLLTADDRKGGWRPGGAQLLDIDAAGKLYAIFHPEGGDGSHQNPGTEVWVFDTAGKKRERRITLKNPGMSVLLTRDDKPLMVVNALTEAGFVIDVYDAASGEWLRSMTDFGQETPFVSHVVR